MKKNIYFLFCLISFQAFSQRADYQLYFQNETLLLPENSRDFIENPILKDSDFFNGKAYRIFQFYKIPKAETLNQLAKDGVVLLDYFPENAYLAAIDKKDRYTFLQKYNIRSISEVKPLWKINASILPTIFGNWAKHGETEEFVFQCIENADYNKAKERLIQEGLVIKKDFPSRKYCFAVAQIADIERIAKLPFIAHVDALPPTPKPEDADSRALHDSNMLDNEFTGDLKINGEGVNLQIRDDGFVGSHIDFKGRLTDLSRYNGQTNHGDKVTSVAGGAGNLDSKVKGIATGAHFFITEYDQSFTDTTIGLHKYHKIMVTNTSYSDGCNRYTNVSQTVDIQHLENKELLHIFSCGNNNGANCGYGAGSQWGNITGGHKQSKNSISVANIDDNMAIAVSSSRGPAHDGRLKPDVSAHGTNVRCADPNNVYTASTGTSFSAPITAGILGLMYQTYRMENQGADPDGALMKAVLLNTATEIGNFGPDYKFGWGVANAQRAVNAIQNQWYLTGNVEDGQTTKFVFKMPEAKMAKVMICWADPAANPGTRKALINDLDLSIISPNGTRLMPYKLNPEPKIASLNAQASFGRDSLNNVEQVTILKPETGQIYEIEVKGFKVPKGTQPFYISFDYYDEDLEVVDVKKEGFFQSETIPVRWITTGGDSSQVTISFSSDNGTTWSAIGKAKATAMHVYYPLPKINTDKAKFKYEYQGKEYFSSTFSICQSPNLIAINKVCPDSMTIDFTPIDAPVSYEIMRLGDKKMEVIGKTKNNSITLPIPKGFFNEKTNWLTIRTVFDSSGMIGRRRNAISYTTQLKNCPLNNDLAIGTTLTRPLENYSSQCAPMLTDSVVISYRNAGKDTINSVDVYYQFGNQPIVKETIQGVLKPNETKNYVFNTKLNIGGIGKSNLKVWADLVNDNFHFNDTLTSLITYNLLSTNNYAEKFGYLQSFNDAASQYPYGWGVTQNKADNIKWAKTDMVSSDDKRNGVMTLFCAATTATSLNNELYSAPVEVDSTIENPYLLFDLAYGGGSSTNTATDRFQVFIHENCERDKGVKVLDLSGKRLSSSNEPSIWQPDNGSSWRTEIVDLQAYKGKKISVSFVGISSRIGVLYLDNVRFQNHTPKKAVAEIVTSSNSICLGDTIFYSAKNIDPTHHYLWNFQGGNVSTAVGAGPIPVVYTANVANTAVSMQQTSILGSSSAQLAKITILKNPVSKFTYVKDTLTFTFTNTSTDATEYLWSFGDGNSSTLENPTHTYIKPGTYIITLTATNSCQSNTSVRSASASTNSNDLINAFAAEILPNPNQGAFALHLNLPYSINGNIKIMDVTGKVISSKEVNLYEGEQRLTFDQLELSKGMYYLQISSGDKIGVMKFIVE